ncbi:hypothetical protein LCGC14_0535400 [marine sediment metagenome]|uniref:Uncharacterized protein n=1 Tax=marine sediment metagenome TaxID=412755 RepID=A0A0F9UFR5_9ZZZZ
MEERNEEQKIAQASIEVILGGDKYQIKPLVIRDSREWRHKIIKLIAPLPNTVTRLNIDSVSEFEESLREMLVTNPDEVLNLFFEYAKELNKKEIEAKATDAEMAIAFQEVVKVAFPLAESLPKVMARLAQ